MGSSKKLQFPVTVHSEIGEGGLLVQQAGVEGGLLVQQVLGAEEGDDLLKKKIKIFWPFWKVLRQFFHVFGNFSSRHLIIRMDISDEDMTGDTNFSQI